MSYLEKLDNAITALTGIKESLDPTMLITLDKLIELRDKEIEMLESSYMSIADMVGVNAYKHGGNTPMAKGGRVRFKDKVAAISKRLEGTEVPARLRKDYGKYYDKDESKVAASRIAGSMLKKERKRL